MADPTCSLHGVKWSEHAHGGCLYCVVCFKQTITRLREAEQVVQSEQRASTQLRLDLWQAEQTIARLRPWLTHDAASCRTSECVCGLAAAYGGDLP